MSSSIEENFQPPEWASREEVIKAAQHYINYWKIEARQRNGQWLQALDENARLKAEVERLRKAGDAMAEEYRKMCKGEYSEGWFHRLFAGDENFNITHLDNWNAAKDGKPSEVDTRSFDERVKALTDSSKGRWDGCPPSDEYIRQLRGENNAAKDGKPSE